MTTKEKLAHVVLAMLLALLAWKQPAFLLVILILAVPFWALTTAINYWIWRK